MGLVASICSAVYNLFFGWSAAKPLPLLRDSLPRAVIAEVVECLSLPACREKLPLTPAFYHATSRRLDEADAKWQDRLDVALRPIVNFDRLDETRIRYQVQLRNDREQRLEELREEIERRRRGLGRCDFDGMDELVRYESRKQRIICEHYYQWGVESLWKSYIRKHHELMEEIKRRR